MKPVQINFVEPRVWKAIWAGAGLGLMCIVTVTSVQMWRYQQDKVALQAELNQLQSQRMQQQLDQQPSAAPVINPRAASEAAAARLLLRDWNVLFNAVETPALAKFRLVRLSFNAQTGQALLEYELEHMEQVAQVTDALNAAASGHASLQLERLENAQLPGGAGGQGKVRGIWLVQVQ